MTASTHKQKLEQLLTDVTAELKTIATQDEATGDWVAVPEGHQAEADPNSEADVVEDWNERRALMAQLETRYHNVVIALKKFETGTYGICEVSGDPIEERRLDVNPAARTNMINMEKERQLPF